MKPEKQSLHLLSVTQAKAKMFEYETPEEFHIAVPKDPSRLLRLAIGILGDVAAEIASVSVTATERIRVQSEVRFSARYFHSYEQTGMANGVGSYLRLLSATAYYLAELPGSSSVLVATVEQEDSGDYSDIAELLSWCLLGFFDNTLPLRKGPFASSLLAVSRAIVKFFNDGRSGDEIWAATSRLRRLVYSEGSQRALLLADCVAAVARYRHISSSWFLLPRYTSIPAETWRSSFHRDRAIVHLWPAQQLIGERGIYSGSSGVIQIPTSAGKSRAMELVLRSAFLSERISLAVVVAPFRALCHEIHDNLEHAFSGQSIAVDQISDTFLTDYDLDALLSGSTVIVLTPEKLVYILRHDEQLASRVGLLILDEGHQFDTGRRGVTYELLISALNQLLPEQTQKVLISAVISNAEEVNSWLNGADGKVVAGSHLTPTERTIAFTSWQERFGWLHFVDSADPDRTEFFVPRVIRPTRLPRLKNEKKDRYFPELGNPRSIALYLGLSLIQNGSVAIFCGRKDSATILCEMLMNLAARGAELKYPVEFSHQAELEKVAKHYSRNLGAQAPAAVAARMGILTHHGSTPHGVRLAVEHAMRFGHARFIVCTSTLAQGVNLPIRYLIVTSAQQGPDKIKARDFQNLMGRAGRSGMHVEGTVLFADPDVFDLRHDRKRSKWRSFTSLVRADQSEPCASTLLKLLLPLETDSGRSIAPLAVVEQYYNDKSNFNEWARRIALSLAVSPLYALRVESQLLERKGVLEALESYLMTYGNDEEGNPLSDDELSSLAGRTLAHFLATSNQRLQLAMIFKRVSRRIFEKVPEYPRRRTFGRTLFGLRDALWLEDWAIANFQRLRDSGSVEDLLRVLWEAIDHFIEGEGLGKFIPAPERLNFSLAWIGGASFEQLLKQMIAARVLIKAKSQTRALSIEAIVEAGETSLGYEGALVVAGATEILLGAYPDEEPLQIRLSELQKRIKYGLPSMPCAHIFELGLSDRLLSIELGSVVGSRASRSDTRRSLRAHRTRVAEIVSEYPAYYRLIASRVV